MKQVLHKDSADYIYQLLTGVMEKDDPIQGKMILLNQLYTFVLRNLTDREKLFFSSNYERSVFVIDQYRLPSALSQQMRGLGYLMQQLKPSANFTFEEEHFKKGLKTLSSLTTFMSGVNVPEKLSAYHGDLAEAILNPNYVEAKNEIDLLDGMVLEIGEIQQDGDDKYLEIVCASKALGKIKIKLGWAFLYLKSLLWKFARINCLALQKMKKQDDSPIVQYQTSPQSLVILAPDFLVDASAIAQCFLRSGSNPMMYIIKKFENLLTNYYFMRGNIVNSYLDEHLSSKSPSIPDLFRQYIRQKPFYALVFDNQDYRRIQNEVSKHIQTLNNPYIQSYKQRILSLEPTFLSEIYGLRGRLDVLVEYEDEPNRLDVIELKTSKDPKQYGQMVRSNDKAQAICYNLLLNSINKDQKGSSAILYSSVPPQDNPIRNVPNDITSKRSVLKVRNGIVFAEHWLDVKPAFILNKVNETTFQKNQLYESEIAAINHFRKTLDGSLPLERAYFYDFVRFVAREQAAATIGASNQRGDDGFAALWNHDLHEKRSNYKIIDRLQFDHLDQEGDKIMIYFKRNEVEEYLATIRKGDFVLLYPQEDNGDLKPTKHQILKGTIQQLNNEQLVISPLNANVNQRHFERYTYWAIEPEFSNVAFDVMHKSLFQFLEAHQDKKDILLGLRKPEFSKLPSKKEFDKRLKPTQKTLLAQALAAKDYFLLQGPPGTGKTSFMLRELVIQLLKNPHEKIILLAYTNRAVDEICQAIKSIEDTPLFFRLGYGSSTEHKDVLLSHFARQQKLKELKQKILESRIFVATVLTFQRSPELAQNMKFTTAIIDEASQLLEPQIVGVLCQVNKFILIGDEKQLPAVVVQSSDVIPPQSEDLKEIGLTNLSNSLFERLLNRCIENKWKAFGRLKDQGRMHQQIQDFPNQQYYDGDLSPINPKIQCAITPEYWKENVCNLEEILKSKRTLFIPTKVENLRNVNIGEAKLVGELVKDLAPLFDEENLEKGIGIITPYRAQIAEIRKHLPDQLVDRLTIDTVERFQGSQRKVIIISLALNNARQLSLLEVLDDAGVVDRKLNVALTRAQDYLIILGCPDVLKESPVYKSLLDYYEEKDFLFNSRWSVVDEVT